MIWHIQFMQDIVVANHRVSKSKAQIPNDKGITDNDENEIAISIIDGRIFMFNGGEGG